MEPGRAPFGLEATGARTFHERIFAQVPGSPRPQKNNGRARPSVGRAAHAREKKRGQERVLCHSWGRRTKQESPELLESRKKRCAAMGARAPPLAPSCLAPASGHWSTGSTPGAVVPSPDGIRPWRRRARPRRAPPPANREEVLGTSSGAGPAVAARAPTPPAEEARGAARRKPGAARVRAPGGEQGRAGQLR